MPIARTGAFIARARTNQVSGSGLPRGTGEAGLSQEGLGDATSVLESPSQNFKKGGGRCTTKICIFFSKGNATIPSATDTNKIPPCRHNWREKWAAAGGRARRASVYNALATRPLFIPSLILFVRICHVGKSARPLVFTPSPDSPGGKARG